jgi:hypothetical protein
LAREVGGMKVLWAAALCLGAGTLGWSQSQTWEGLVTDTHCGTHCQRTSAMTPDRACIKRCVQQGSKYGLWFKEQVVVLEPQVSAAKFAGEKVRVTGDLAQGVIHIETIAAIH